MEFAEHIGVIRANAAALADAARSTPLDTRVPTCPAWTLRRLVGHLGSHYLWVGHNLDRAPDMGMFPYATLPSLPPADGVGDWLEAGAFSLADKLAAVGPDHVCWTWMTDQTSRFWARRSAQETVMHSWDGLNAAGVPPGVDTVVAVDGIDEYLDIVPVGFWAEGSPTGDDERIQLIAADGDAAWQLLVDRTGTHVTREQRGSDVVVSGSASDLLLFVMGRVPADALTWTGDPSVFRRWHEQVTF